MTAASSAPSQRWHAIEAELRARGILERIVFLRDSGVTGVDQFPYGVIELSAPPAHDLARATADLEALFEQQAMVVVDTCVARDDSGSGSFVAWFHPRERLPFLAQLPEAVARRVQLVAERLEQRGVRIVEQEHCETEHGPQGRLVLRRRIVFVPDRAHDGDSGQRTESTVTAKDNQLRILDIVDVERGPADALGEEDDEVELALGRWGWVSSEPNLWLLPLPPGTTAELDNLVVADIGIATIESVVEDSSGAWAPTWEDVVGAAVAVNILAPFVQTLARRTGEDIYETLRKLMNSPAGSQGRTRLHDPDAGTDLVFDLPLPDEAVMQLARIEPARLKKRIAEWDQESQTWRISRQPRRRT